MKRSTRRIGPVGYVMGIVISVLVTLVIVQSFVVEREQRGCERRQPIFQHIEAGFRDAAGTLPPGSELRRTLLLHADAIKKRIVLHCDDVYPSIIPFID